MKQFTLRPSLKALTTPTHLAWLLLALIMLTYSVEMSYQTILRYDTFKATGFDLGNMDQVLWNTIHGHPFQFTNQGVDWYGPPTRLAIHFEPILLPLSLLYVFYADPRILLVFQTLVLVAGALPVFLLTRRYIAAWPLLAPTMALAYLLAPALLGLNLFDFHPVSLATPLLLYALLALTYQRYGWFLVACIGASACKEDIPLAVAMLGVMLVWKYKLPRLGSLLIIGGTLWSLLAFMVIIPHFYPGTQHNNFWYRYEGLGSSPGAAVGNVILHPWLLFTTFVTMDRIYYLVNLIRSTGFLSVLAPEWLLPALPSLAVNLLSSDTSLNSGVYHYNAAIIPFVMISAIQGARHVYAIWQHWRGEESRGEEAIAGYKRAEGKDIYAPRILVGMLTFMSFAAQVLLTRLVLLRATIIHALGTHPAFVRSTTALQPQTLIYFRDNHWQRFNARMVPLASNISLPLLQWIMCGWLIMMIGLNFAIMTPKLNIFWADHTPGGREQHIQQLLAMIPPDASVAAGENLNPHVSERRYVTVFPAITIASTDKQGSSPVQYVIVDLHAIFPEDQVSTTNLLNQLVSSKQYRILARAEGVILLVRRSP